MGFNALNDIHEDESILCSDFVRMRGEWQSRGDTTLLTSFIPMVGIDDEVDSERKVDSEVDEEEGEVDDVEVEDIGFFR